MTRQIKKDQIEHSATIPNLVDVCVDQDGNPVFLLRKDEELLVETKIQNGEKHFIPPPFHSMPWLLPRVDNVREHFLGDDDGQLFKDIQEAIEQNCYLPDKRLYPFFTAWILHTHLIDKVNYSPIIIFYAVQARGKTRTCRLLLWMARRGVHVETIREADIIRKSSRFGSVMFFDVMDIWQKAERMNSTDILLGRFDSGITVPRVTNPERSGFDDTQHFRCYGPTLIATNEPAHHILNSRGILITMQQAPYNYENDPREHDFLDLKERCTAFRARWLNKALPVVEKPSKNRLGDILRPIAQVIKIAAHHFTPDFFELIKTFEGNRAEAQSESPEGQLIKALIELEGDIVEGKIETQKIIDRINHDKPERYHTSPINVGKRMSALGFQSARHGSSRAWEYDQVLIRRLAEDYGHSHLFSDTSGNSGNRLLSQTPEKPLVQVVSNEPPDWNDPDAFNEWATNNRERN